MPELFWAVPAMKHSICFAKLVMRYQRSRGSKCGHTNGALKSFRQMHVVHVHAQQTFVFEYFVAVLATHGRG
jgi:hypothetical protein